jgi:tRNA(adenine34) deaminase
MGVTKPSLQIDESWMKFALELAQQAQESGEIPVGAIIVQEEQIIGRGCNQPIKYHDPSAHAEMVAMRDAGQNISNYRLIDTTLYVTLEPCVMCTGALMHARVDRVVFGANDPKAGAAGGKFNLLEDPRFNHQINVTGGVLAEECAQILKQFFKSKR